MKRPRARAGRTPMSSRVRIVEAPADVGVGGGDPWRPGGGGAAAFTGCRTRIDVVSGPLDVVAGLGRTATPPDAGTAALAEAAPGADAAALGAAVRRWGRRAICASSSRTVCGRCAGSLARTLTSSPSSSSGRFGLIFTAEGIGVLTVA